MTGYVVNCGSNRVFAYRTGRHEASPKNLTLCGIFLFGIVEEYGEQPST